MRCLQCGKRVSLLRKLTDGEFCSDEHRLSFQQQQNDLALARLIEAQRGMTRPAPKPAAASKTKAAKAGASTDLEAAPPFGGFQRLTLMGIRLRLLHTPDLAMLATVYPPLVPFHEFRTLIMGVTDAGTVAWSGARASWLDIGILNGDVPTLPFLAEPRQPVAGLRTENLPIPESRLPAQPMPDPPWAEMVAVSQTAAAVGGSSVARHEQPPVPAFVGQPVRWVPVREESDVAPAPEAGLLPVKAWPASGARLMAVAAFAPLQTEAEAAAFAPKRAALRLCAAGTLCVDDAIRPIPAGEPVAPRGAVRLDLAVSGFWTSADSTLPAAKLRFLEAAGAWCDGARLQPLTRPAMMQIRQDLRCSTFPASTISDAALPPAAFRADQFDFRACLEGQTTPAAETPAEIEPAFADLAVLSLPELAIAGTPTWLPLAIRLAQSPWQDPVFLSLATQADSMAFWAILDRLTSEQTATAEPEALPAAVELPATLESLPAEAEELSAEPEPPLFTRLQPILAWRLCEPAPTEIRTPDNSRSTMWQRQIETPPAKPRLSLSPDNAESAAGNYSPVRSSRKPEGASFRSRFAIPRSWKVWQHAPADLKWVAVGLPLIMALVLYSFRGSQPKEQAGVKLASSQSQSILGTQFASLQRVIMQRAAIHLLDDFRSGLSAWEGKPGWAKSWKYGEATFLEPGQLAVYKPTVPMKDYTLEFLGQIERQGLSWVVRADDKLRNYHVLRLAITRPGPMPEAAMVRYSVTDGKEGPVTSLPLPFPIKMSTMYRVRVEVRGKEITTYLQGQVVDSFSDTRLRAGGVGFFSSRGERALLRWVEVTHQYDYLGRFCALLAPYDVQAGGERAD